jgi:hypothetical protein
MLNMVLFPNLWRERRSSRSRPVAQVTATSPRSASTHPDSRAHGPPIRPQVLSATTFVLNRRADRHVLTPRECLGHRRRDASGPEAASPATRAPAGSSRTIWAPARS